MKQQEPDQHSAPPDTSDARYIRLDLSEIGGQLGNRAYLFNAPLDDLTTATRDTPGNRKRRLNNMLDPQIFSIALS